MRVEVAGIHDFCGSDGPHLKEHLSMAEKLK
jgi:hypothetical protein